MLGSIKQMGKKKNQLENIKWGTYCKISCTFNSCKLCDLLLKVAGSTKSLLVHGDWPMTSQVKMGWEAFANLSLDISVSYLIADYFHEGGSQRVEDRVAGLDVCSRSRLCLLVTAVFRQQTSTQAGRKHQASFKTLQQVVSWSWVFWGLRSVTLKAAPEWRTWKYSQGGW